MPKSKRNATAMGARDVCRRDAGLADRGAAGRLRSRVWRARFIIPRTGDCRCAPRCHEETDAAILVPCSPLDAQRTDARAYVCSPTHHEHVTVTRLTRTAEQRQKWRIVVVSPLPHGLAA
jgi:hypothetical protein